MSVEDLIRELTELRDTYGKHVRVVINLPVLGVRVESEPDEAKYEQGKIIIR